MIRHFYFFLAFVTAAIPLRAAYVVNGKMTGGFAFVAYPAEYRSSGVMTFIVDESGTIYEKDLGPDTMKLAQAMTAYDPDATWHKAD